MALKPLPYELTGNSSSTELLVFMHGWPDTTSLWDSVIGPLEEQNYYMLNVSYPNFSKDEQNPKGNDFDEILERLKLTIDKVNDTRRRVVIVSHDWGALFSYWFDQKYPNYITEIITLDVGLGTKPKPFMVFYQVFLAIAYMIGGFIGNAMTKKMVDYFGYKPSCYQRIDSSWNYPYYYIWKRILGAVFLRKTNRIPFLKKDLTCNVVYTWGYNKPFQFHSEKWLKSIVKQNPKNEVHLVSTGHWIMKENPKFVTDLIIRRIGYLRSGRYPHLL